MLMRSVWKTGMTAVAGWTSSDGVSLNMEMFTWSLINGSTNSCQLCSVIWKKPRWWMLMFKVVGYAINRKNARNGTHGITRLRGFIMNLIVFFFNFRRCMAFGAVKCIFVYILNSLLIKSGATARVVFCQFDMYARLWYFKTWSSAAPSILCIPKWLIYAHRCGKRPLNLVVR